MKAHEIKSLRKSLGLSKEQFALKLGFKGGRSLSWRWEHTGKNSRRPSAQTVILMKQLEAKSFTKGKEGMK